MFDFDYFDYDAIIEKLIEWASKVWDWIKNFIPYVYDKIVSLLSVVQEWIKDAIEAIDSIGKKIQAVLTDPRFEKGRKIIDILRGSEGSRIPGDANSIAFTMTGENVEKMASFTSSNIEDPSKFDNLMEENDGILIIK